MQPACRMLWWASGPLGLLAGIFTLWGPWAAALGIGQALLAIVMVCLRFWRHLSLLQRGCHLKHCCGGVSKPFQIS